MTVWLCKCKKQYVDIVMGDDNDNDNDIIRNLNTTLNSFTKITAKAMDTSPPSYLKSMNELLDSFSEITNPTNPTNPAGSEPPPSSSKSGMFDSFGRMLKSGLQAASSISFGRHKNTSNHLANSKIDPIIPPSDDFEHSFLINENQNDFDEDADDDEKAKEEQEQEDKPKKRAKGKTGKNNSRTSEWKPVEDCKITTKDPAGASRNVEIKCEDNPDFNAKLPNTDIAGEVIQVNMPTKSKKSIDRTPDPFGINMAYRPVGPRITKHSNVVPSK